MSKQDRERRVMVKPDVHAMLIRLAEDSQKTIKLELDSIIRNEYRRRTKDGTKDLREAEYVDQRIVDAWS